MERTLGLIASYFAPAMFKFKNGTPPTMDNFVAYPEVEQLKGEDEIASPEDVFKFLSALSKKV